MHASGSKSDSFFLDILLEKNIALGEEVLEIWWTFFKLKKVQWVGFWY